MDGNAAQLMSILTVSTYAVVGVTKFGAGLGWLTGEVLRDQVAFDNVRKAALGSEHVADSSSRYWDHAVWPSFRSRFTLAVEWRSVLVRVHRAGFGPLPHGVSTWASCC